MFAKVASVAVVGLDARRVDVEVDITGGLPDFHVVGLPSTAVKESRRRVRAAVVNSGRPWPQRKITANLAPSDLRKDGAGFDLPLAIGVMASFGEVPLGPLSKYLLAGELALDGSLRPIRGALAAAMFARDRGFSGLLVPMDNHLEAGLVKGVDVIGVRNLAEAASFLQGDLEAPAVAVKAADLLGVEGTNGPDLSEVRGQAAAVRGLEIAAAGGHNVLMVGPPGCGKTMMAQCLPSIMPPLTESEALEATRVWSVAGLLDATLPMVVHRPFRAPHHHASAAAIIGGGSPVPLPGEISLAHRGVLFLDELPFFSRLVLEALRQPLEEGTIRVVRSGWSVSFPASVSLVAAANPCLCGRAGSLVDPCRCPPGRLESYRSRLSGPLLDRMDLWVEVPRLSEEELFEVQRSEPSLDIRQRVVAARRFREQRLAAESAGGTELRRLRHPVRSFLRRTRALESSSARSLDRLLKVARSIADLAACPDIEEAHVAEALQYRRKVWGLP
ncbi:MAG: YifB family Mg chelatase-like AAA ATPase [Actinomycetota bacterium]